MLEIKSPRIDEVRSSILDEQAITLKVLRLDEIHPLVTGSKWFKLKLNISYVQEKGITSILSFGGAYSNHILALAVIGKMLGIETIGIIRGELVEPLNPVLKFAREQGMILRGMDRSNYRQKHKAWLIKKLRLRFGDFYLLPEGGSNELAVKGCETLAQFIPKVITQRGLCVALPCGTGATMAGLIRGLACCQRVTVLGFSVLKAEGYLATEVAKWTRATACTELPAWQVIDDYHCGGYAKSNAELSAFMECWKTDSNIPLEPVYTGKMFYGLFKLIEAGYYREGTEILAIHTGGFLKTHHQHT
ncbi:MAG: pyridoxal-phosphate dependent enzyme [Pseudomonadota bacterium]|nr:pyridoxal-phosphate dependent enzyme [Pseudomonadota bacterium]